MCIILVSPLYLHIFWPLTSMLQNAKYHHLPSRILFNSYLPSAKSIWVNRRASRESFCWAGSPLAMLLLLHGPSVSPAPTSTNGTLAAARTDQKWGVQPAGLGAETQLGVSRSSPEQENWE